MAKVIGRVWDVIVGLVMLIAAAALQAIFLTLLVFAVAGVLQCANVKTGNALLSGIAIAVFAGFNAASCWVYFRRLRRTGFDRGDARVEGIGGPRSTSATGIIFLVPRALSRMALGSERLFGRTQAPPRGPED